MVDRVKELWDGPMTVSRYAYFLFTAVATIVGSQFALLETYRPDQVTYPQPQFTEEQRLNLIMMEREGFPFTKEHEKMLTQVSRDVEDNKKSLAEIETSLNSLRDSVNLLSLGRKLSRPEILH